MKNKIKQIFKILLGSIFVFFILFSIYIVIIFNFYNNDNEVQKITTQEIKGDLKPLKDVEQKDKKTIKSLNSKSDNINSYYSYVNEMSNDISMLKQVLKELKIDNKDLNEKIFTFEKVFESMSRDLKTHNFNRLDLVALDYLFFKKDAFVIISAKYEGLRSEK